MLFICFPVVLRHAGLSARQNIKRVSRLSYVVADLVGVRLVQDKAEAKVAALEARSEEQRKERAQAEAEWRRQQRDRELKRAQEEIEREKEARPCCFAQHPLLHVLCLVRGVKCCAACKLLALYCHASLETSQKLFCGICLHCFVGNLAAEVMAQVQMSDSCRTLSF